MTHEKRRYSAGEMLENASEWASVRIGAAQVTAEMLRQAAEEKSQVDGLVYALDRLLSSYSFSKPPGYPLSDSEKLATEALSKFRGGENEAV